MSGIDAVVTETGLVPHARAEDVGFTESNAAVKIVVESGRSFVAPAPGCLENCRVSAGLNLIAVAGEGGIFFRKSVIEPDVKVVLVLSNFGFGPVVERAVAAAIR